MGGNSFFKTLFWVQISKSSIYAKDSVESELQHLASSSHIDHQHIILGLNTVHRLTGILLLMFNVVVCYCIIMCCNCMYLLFGLHCCILCAKLLIYHFCLTCHGLQMKSSLLAKSSIFTLRHSSVPFKYMYSSSKIQMFITRTAAWLCAFHSVRYCENQTENFASFFLFFVSTTFKCPS